MYFKRIGLPLNEADSRFILSGRSFQLILNRHSGSWDFPKHVDQ
jgi:hypothetical protein